MVGPGTYLRITPTESWSWNLEGEPVGDTWYASRKAVHDPPPPDAYRTRGRESAE
jgi:pyridoxamine 5'-phosphate oxidase family protein